MSGRIRCGIPECNKKLRLAEQIECKCSLFLCIRHRFTADHNCTFDYKKEQKNKLIIDNPKVVADKVVRI